MKTAHIKSRRGSALVTVIIFSMMVMLVVTSTLGYSLNERRLNHREALRLEARNAAEAISEYGLAQVRQLMESRSDFTSTRFTATHGSIKMPSTSFWAGSNVVTSGSSAPDLVIGLINQITSGSSTGLYYYDPTDPNNENELLKGRYAFRFDIRVLSKATVAPATGQQAGAQTIYMTQTLSARASPLFSHAIFYNMDLEIWPGPTMNILGGVHTNGNLYVKKQSSNGRALNFLGPVTIAGKGMNPLIGGPPPFPVWAAPAPVPQVGMYAGVKTVITNTNGTTDDLSGYTDNVFFQTAAGGLVGLHGPAPNTTTPKFWRDQKWGKTVETTTTTNVFKNWASQTYGGNLQTPLHGVQVVKMPGIEHPTDPTLPTYIEDPTPDNGVDDSVNLARQLIEAPLASGDAGYNANTEAVKYARLCGLYIVVNATDTTRNGRLPTGATVSMPAFSYRTFTKAGTEVVLPGQPNYGANNATANAYANAAGPAVVKIRQDAIRDIRRAEFNWSKNRSSSNRYSPKQIDLIDIDMTALKLAVDRTINEFSTSQVYRTATPANGTSTNNANWTGFIYNNTPSGSGASTLPPATNLTDAHKIMNPATGDKIGAADWNGGIYIQSVAAESVKRSGVRLINGRGKVASKGSEGLTIATNDALYILGHYNADGFIDASTAANNTTNNGRFPDDANETPCSIACDALTILSTPSYSNNGTTISQSLGWNDAYSYHRNDDVGSYTTGWATTSPSGSNTVDGINTSAAGYRVPYDSTSGTLAATQTMKNPGAHTEISAAFLAGIVVSNKDGNGQNSGGANNYPRFLEDFSASGTQTKVCIRGSIVAMFESRVATEPWNWRTFDAPDRLWGFHNLFAQGKFPPLTPRVMSYRRVDFNDIGATEYNSVKTGWGL